MLKLLRECTTSSYRRLLHRQKPWLVVRRYCTPQRLSMMMTQYDCVKKQYPKHVLLYQVGDFYEIYYSDAGINLQRMLAIVCQAEDIRVYGRAFHEMFLYDVTLVVRIVSLHCTKFALREMIHFCTTSVRNIFIQMYWCPVQLVIWTLLQSPLVAYVIHALLIIKV